MYQDHGLDIQGLPPDVEKSIKEAVFAFRESRQGISDGSWRVKAFGPAARGKFTAWVITPGSKKPGGRDISATEAAKIEIAAWLDELCPASSTLLEQRFNR
jgi:hypothetical protein